MGKCLTSMNCNDSENTRYLDSASNAVEVDDKVKHNNKSRQKQEKKDESNNFGLKLVKYPQIVLSIGNMLISQSTYSYMYKTNSNFQDFIESKLKGISASNQILISKFMFENVKIRIISR